MTTGSRGRWTSPKSLLGDRRPDLAVSLGLGGAMLLGILTAMFPLLGVGVAVLVVGILLLRFRPESISVLAVGLIYSNAVVIFAQRGTVPSSAGALLIAALGLSVIRRAYVERTVATSPLAMSLVLAFGAIECLSALFSIAPATAQTEVATTLTEGMLLFTVTAFAVADTKSLVGVVNALLLVGACLGALSLIQHLTGDYTNDFYGFAGVSDALVPGGSVPGQDLQPRLNGNIGETNRYAQVLAVLLPLAAARAAMTSSTVVRWLSILAGLLISGGIVYTYSRGTAVAIAAALITVTALRWVRLRWLVGGAVLGLVLVLATPGYGDRLLSLQAVTGATALQGSNAAADNAVRGRTTEVLAALLAFADHPVLGVGPGVFPSVYPQYAQQVGIRPRLQEREAHNLFAGTAAETGVFGLVTFVMILLTVLTGLAEAVRRWQPVDRGRQVLAQGFFAAILVYIYSGMFLHLSYVRYFWLLVALAAAAGRLPGQETRPWTVGLPWRRRTRRPPGAPEPAGGRNGSAAVGAPRQPAPATRA